MKRTQFVAVGQHPLFVLVITSLISKGYELLPNMGCRDLSRPVFVLAGCEVFTQAASLSVLTELRNVSEDINDVPVLLLSSSSVYSDRDHSLALRAVTPMDEALGHVITSPLDETAVRPLTALMVEHAVLLRSGRTVVIRPFNVYGPNVQHGLISNLFKAALLGNTLEIATPGRQTRTFLYEEDFLSGFHALLGRLLKGHRGIYNLGSEEQVELLSVAKSVGHALNKELMISLVETKRHVWWKLPDIARAQVDAKFRPRVSLRNGLFRIAEEK